MEQRKVLLIVASVSVVLAVTIGVGLWLFYPRDDAVAVADARRTGGLEWEPLDFLQGLSDRPGLDRVPDDRDRRDDSFEVTYGVTVDPPVRPDTTRAPEDGPLGVRGVPSDPATPAAPTDTRRVAVETVPATPRVDPAPTAAPTPAPPRQPAPTPSRPAVVTAPAPAPRTDPAPAARAAQVPAVRTASQAYWVQVISSPNLDTAEQAQRTLAERQLGTRIMTRDINGTIYYRLRLGPFALRTEAEKFLDSVLEIRQFSDAMIFVDYSTPVVDPARS